MGSYLSFDKQDHPMGSSAQRHNERFHEALRRQALAMPTQLQARSYYASTLRKKADALMKSVDRWRATDGALKQFWPPDDWSPETMEEHRDAAE